MNITPLENIFKINLKVNPYEKVLIFNDTIRQEENLSPEEIKRRKALREIANVLKKIGKDFTKEILYTEYPATGCHGIEPPEEIWKLGFGEKVIKKLKKAGIFEKLISKNISDKEILKTKEIIKENCSEAVNAVIALSNFSTSHTYFRDLITKVCKARYASMPLFDPSMLNGAMNADWKKVYERSLRIKKILDNAIKIKIKTPNGTEIEMLKGKRKVYIDSGILTRKGAFGNLPAGEVFFAPLENFAKGILVIEWAPTRKLESPIVLNIENGKVMSIEGKEPYKRELENKLNERAENRNIAELGIGTNDKATKPDNILESEKILGTVHIALGDNSSFGGKVRTPFHQDFIFFEPSLYAIQDNGEILKIFEKGSLLIE